MYIKKSKTISIAFSKDFKAEEDFSFKTEPYNLNSISNGI